MLYLSKEDFFKKAAVERISRDEEKAYAVRMKNGDIEARSAIVTGYLPFVASYLKRTLGNEVSLEAIYRCVGVLEDLVDKFNFLQDSESFVHRLGLQLRNTLNGYIADR